eukprot:TRINITY_DN30446_c0_g2_i2.p1 TRINITY_DN30446_c0_g2~~TRINITY_DN30446_c0_g2_i2.p1  ORF type:complete len:314 (+),score=21.49 TRINITY_DN30446_c0_g2_i2:41-943(+)
MLVVYLVTVFVSGFCSCSPIPFRSLLQNRQSVDAVSNVGHEPLMVQGIEVSLSDVSQQLFEDLRKEGGKKKVQDPLAFPYNTVGRLFMNCPCRKTECTATLLSPRLVVTAAHCIYDVMECDKAWKTPRCCEDPCRNLQFQPAFPIGSEVYNVSWPSVPVIFYDGFMSGKAFTEYAQYDLAILALDEDAPLASQTLTYGFPGCQNETIQTFIVGYSTDLQDSDNMFIMDCDIDVDTCNEESNLPCTCDMQQMMSGSSIWERKDGNIILRGIHSNIGGLSVAVLFTQSVAKTLENTAFNVLP